MVEAHVKFGGYLYVIEANWIPLLRNKYNYVARILKVLERTSGKDVTVSVGESYGVTPGEAIDKVFKAACTILGE